MTTKRMPVLTNDQFYTMLCIYRGINTVNAIYGKLRTDYGLKKTKSAFYQQYNPLSRQKLVGKTPLVVERDNRSLVENRYYLTRSGVKALKEHCIIYGEMIEQFESKEKELLEHKKAKKAVSR